MALKWWDGFESYNNATDLGRLPNCTSISTIAFGTAYGRRSGQQGMRLVNFASDFRCGWAGSPQTVIIGVAFKLTDKTPGYSADRELLTIRSAFNSTIHLRIYIEGGLFRFRNEANGVLATTSGHVINLATWYFVETKITISNTVGQITCRVDESEVLSTAANLDTCNGANEYAGGLDLSCCYPSQYTYYDDLYVCDTLGSKNNDFLGDIRIDPIRVNGAGTYSQLTPSAGNNEDNVDEIPGPDDDTTYNYGTTIGLKDSYALGDLPSPAATTIYGVKSQVTVRKEDAGAKKCKILTRAGTTDDLGDEITLSDSYETHTELFEDNPDDAAAWEDADVNGMEIGAEITV